MSDMLYVAILGAAILLGSTSKEPATTETCTPAYFELKEPVMVSVGASKLRFRLLAIGCQENLGRLWPPSREALERAFQPVLREPHPVQILIMIQDRSPELREKLVERANQVFKQPVVYDVFLFEAKAVEY